MGRAQRGGRSTAEEKKIKGDTTPAEATTAHLAGAQPWLEKRVEPRVLVRNVHDALRILAAWQRAHEDERCDRLREVRELRRQICQLEHLNAAAENDVHALRLQLKFLGVTPITDRQGCAQRELEELAA